MNMTIKSFTPVSLHVKNGWRACFGNVNRCVGQVCSVPTSLARCTHSSEGEKKPKMMLKVIILVVGPWESGKTVLSNFLADARYF
jgi:polynucleotide 5'-kinase involved in rRNA processing